MEAERIILVGRGVRGKGELRVDGEKVCDFSDGDFEIEVTTQAAEKVRAVVELVFAPGLPAGMPPTVRIGIDGGLFLRGINQIRITDHRMVPRIVDDYGLIESHLAVTPYMPGRYIFRYAVVLGDETLATEEFTERFSAAVTKCMHRIVLPLPRQWRAGEENELALVRLNVTRAGLVCDNRILHTGFRYATFSAQVPMQLMLGGERMFLAGAEWAEEGLLTDDEIDQRLSALHRARINCLRVYGDQPDALYDALDRRGILLWQVLPGDPSMAESIIRRIRHRPSLIAYGMESVFSLPGRPATLEHPAVQAIAEIVKTYDSATPFFGPIPGDADRIGPCEYPGPGALSEQMNAENAVICTVCVPAPAQNIADLAGGEAYWPPDSPLWAHRAPSQLDIAALSAWFHPEEILPEADAIRLARFLQAETIRYALERARMRCASAAGVFVRDPFERLPSLCSPALFDETGPRPGYWALRSALRPVHACAKLSAFSFHCGAAFEAVLGLLCDSIVMGLLTVRAQLHMEDGCILAETSCDVGPETAEIGMISAELPDFPCVLILRLTVERFGETIDINDYTLCVTDRAPLSPLLDIAKTSVSFLDGSVANDGTHAALGLSGPLFEADFYPGWGVLFPGETRAVTQEGVLEALNLFAGEVEGTGA